MPRGGVPGNRERIERALTPELRDSLEELSVLLDVVDWRHTPLGPPFTAAAALLMAIDLTRGGMAPSTALGESCAHLGIERDTVRSWCRRWPVASRVHYAPTPRTPTAVTLILDAAAGLPLPEAE
jgi:hypothetical protein